MWLNHHTIFDHFERIDRNLVYLNLALLATVVLIPYPTQVFGEALQRGEGERVAAVFYSILMTLNAVAWAGMWLYGSTRRRLLGDDFPEEQRRTATVLFTIGTLIYLATIVVGLINAYACLAVHGALAVYYALDPLYALGVALHRLSCAAPARSWISAAARRPDSIAPWIHACASDACSPAKWMRPSGATIAS